MHASFVLCFSCLQGVEIIKHVPVFLLHRVLLSLVPSNAFVDSQE